MLTATEKANERGWLALIVGTVIVSAHFMVVYAASSLTCRWGWLPGKTVGIPSLQFFQMLVTFLAGVLIGGLIAITYRDWHSTQVDERGEESQQAAARLPLLAFITMLVNTSYLLFILMSLVPILTIQQCA